MLTPSAGKPAAPSAVAHRGSAFLLSPRWRRPPDGTVSVWGSPAHCAARDGFALCLYLGLFNRHSPRVSDFQSRNRFAAGGSAHLIASSQPDASEGTASEANAVFIVFIILFTYERESMLTWETGRELDSEINLTNHDSVT